MYLSKFKLVWREKEVRCEREREVVGPDVVYLSCNQCLNSSL